MKTKLVCLLIASALLVGAASPVSYQITAPVSSPPACCCCVPPPATGDIAVALDYLARAKVNNELTQTQFPIQYYPAQNAYYRGRAEACRDAIEAIHILTAPKTAAEKR